MTRSRFRPDLITRNAPHPVMACTIPGRSGTCRRILTACRNSLPSIAGRPSRAPTTGSRGLPEVMAEPTLDLITIGRVSVDLYGGQVGGRLEDMASFNKYVGGCPANIAVGAARLALRSALLSRVGDEAMGRFIREQLAREGVDTSHLMTDPQRLTALVILGIRDRETFPLIFFRENCADMALTAADFAPEFIASA